jgi:hypothetical protein
MLKKTFLSLNYRWLRQQNFGTTFNPKFEMNKECEVTENPIAFQWTDKERK